MNVQQAYVVLLCERTSLNVCRPEAQLEPFISFKSCIGSEDSLPQNKHILPV